MSNPWLERRVLCYAHQGGAREAPSSTLFAIRTALEAGADAIELDVHQSADGVLVVSHDPSVDRTTAASGAIASMTYAELEQLDNAYWFVPGENALRGQPEEAYVHRGRAPADPRFRVASLESVLEATEGVLLNFDIKQGPPTVPAYEAPLAAMLRDFDRSDDVIVTSFSDAITARFHGLAPEIHTAPGVTALTLGIQAIRSGGPLDRELFAGHVALQVPAQIAGTPLVDERLVKSAHELGLALHVWTVDEPEVMENLVDVGVDGVMSDVPGVLAGLLRRRGANWSGGATD